MSDPLELSSFDFRQLCERCIKEYSDSRIEITTRIALAHGIPFATWISTDEMTRSLAAYCMMSSNPGDTAKSVIAKFLTNLDFLLNTHTRILPEPTHPAPGVTQ